MRSIIPWLRTRDPVILAVTAVFFVIFLAGLASQSQAGTLLGKTARLWFITLVAGVITFGLFVVLWRFSGAAKWINRLALVGVAGLVVIEAIGWLFPTVYPLELLRRTPQWVQNALGDDAFVRADHRPLTQGDAQDDGELGYRSKPNLDLQIIDGEINFREITDSNGFANIDESVYQTADVVVAGDSYSQGFGVGIEESWPQVFARDSGLNVLNLGSDGWHVYQYPRVLYRYAADLSPRAVVVTLRSFEDLSPSYYYYADYRANHPEINNWHEFPGRRRDSAWGRFRSEIKRNITQKNFIRLLYRLTENAVPFTTNGAAYLMDPLGPENLCEFSLNGTPIRLQFANLGQYVGAGIEPALGPINLVPVAEDLNSVKRFAEERGSDLYLIYMPYPEEIYIPLLESASGLNGCAESVLSRYKAGEIELDRFRVQYEKALAPNEDLLLDATAHMQALASQGEQLSWSFNDHPNAAGHLAISKFVESAMGIR